jgi:alkanesulfonate monooxygenase SsuD/methylene tetrahydromethanopterin reductase-like flavin-dependent oxidoreductase (luciferase family)
VKWGFALPQTGVSASPDAIADAGREAERQGFDSVWVLERLLRPLDPRAGAGGPGRAMPDSYSVAYDPIEALNGADGAGPL